MPGEQLEVTRGGSDLSYAAWHDKSHKRADFIIRDKSVTHQQTKMGFLCKIMNSRLCTINDETNMLATTLRLWILANTSLLTSELAPPIPRPLPPR